MQDARTRRPTLAQATQLDPHEHERSADVVARITGTTRPDAADLPLAPSIKATIMRRLTHEQRLLLVLWYVERMSPAEVAAVLGTTEPRVQAMHEGIVARLRTESARLARGAA